MIEKKLQQAAEALPGNRVGFSVVENRATQKAHRPRPVRRRRLAIAMVLAVLLVGCVAGSTPDYHLYNGNWWQFIPGLAFDPADTFDLHWDQTQKAAKKLGIELPETLGGNPVIDYDRFNLTNQETLIQLAWLKPRYIYQSSYYGANMEEPYTGPDGSEGTLHWREGVEIIYGSTNDEIWRRQFGYNEKDEFTASNHTGAWIQVEEITSLVHKGVTIYVCRISNDFLDFPYWEITWVDKENCVVFSMGAEAETPDTLIEYAKEIIDLNK